MTYLEKAQALFPHTARVDIIREHCPLDVFHIPVWYHRDFCLGSGNCTTCWNREYKGEEPR